MIHTPIIICPCCSRPYSRAAWEALPPASGGLIFDHGDGARSEMRNCPCGNTLRVACVDTPIAEDGGLTLEGE